MDRTFHSKPKPKHDVNVYILLYLLALTRLSVFCCVYQRLRVCLLPQERDSQGLHLYRARFPAEGEHGAGELRTGDDKYDFRRYQSGQATVSYSGTSNITVPQYVYTWLILQFCGRSGPTGTFVPETQFRPGGPGACGGRDRAVLLCATPPGSYHGYACILILRCFQGSGFIWSTFY